MNSSKAEIAVYFAELEIVYRPFVILNQRPKVKIDPSNCKEVLQRAETDLTNWRRSDVTFNDRLATLQTAVDRYTGSQRDECLNRIQEVSKFWRNYSELLLQEVHICTLIESYRVLRSRLTPQIQALNRSIVQCIAEYEKVTSDHDLGRIVTK